ncbi:hypothetical protein P5V15_004064 [Pogonomyrmex californicus]
MWTKGSLVIFYVYSSCSSLVVRDHDEYRFLYSSVQSSSLSVAASSFDSNYISEYRCRFCNSPYPTTSHLKSHLTRGCFMDPSFSIEKRRSINKMESRNYVCPKCSQGYKNKRTLDTHLRIACGREPKFQCPYCDLKSKHPPNIYTHIRRKHKGEDLFLIVDQDNR